MVLSVLPYPLPLFVLPLLLSLRTSIDGLTFEQVFDLAFDLFLCLGVLVVFDKALECSYALVMHPLRAHRVQIAHVLLDGVECLQSWFVEF